VAGRGRRDGSTAVPRSAHRFREQAQAAKTRTTHH